MKVTETEVSVFRAIVKALGVYQIIDGALDIYLPLLQKAGVIHSTVATMQHLGDNEAWAVFHFAAAFVLLFGTNAVCRLAFRAHSIGEKSPENA